MKRAATSPTVLYAFGGLLVVTFVVMTWQDHSPLLRSVIVVAAFFFTGLGSFLRGRDRGETNDDQRSNNRHRD